MKLWLLALFFISGSTQASTRWIEFPVGISASTNGTSSGTQSLGTFSYNAACFYLKMSPVQISEWDGIAFCEGMLCHQYHGLTLTKGYFGPFTQLTTVHLMKSGAKGSSITIENAVVGLDSSGNCDEPNFFVTRDISPLTFPTSSFNWKDMQYQLVREPSGYCNQRNEGTIAVGSDGRRVDLKGCILDGASALMFQGRPLIFGRGGNTSVYFHDVETRWLTLNQPVTEFIPVIQGAQLVIFGIAADQSLVMQNFGFNTWQTLPMTCESGLSVTTNGANGYLVSCKKSNGNRDTLEIR